MSKGLRALSRIKEFMQNNAKHWKQNVDCIEKELKALEIIKEETAIYVSEEEGEYWLWVNMLGVSISKEKYDLLKEVLK